jgi:hypothetical protein
MFFTLKNYNEFKGPVRWHDYISIMFNEFPVILVRRYDWFDTERYTFMVQLFGLRVYQKIGNM